MVSGCGHLSQFSWLFPLLPSTHKHTQSPNDRWARLPKDMLWDNRQAGMQPWQTTLLLPSPNAANVSLHHDVPAATKAGIRSLLCVAHRHPCLLWGQLPADYMASLGFREETRSLCVTSGSKGTQALFSKDINLAPASESRQVPS